MNNKVLKAKKDDSGCRLDILLTKKHPDKSRSFFQKFIKSRGVVVNNHHVDPKYIVRENDIIEIKPFPKIEVSLKKEKIELDIVYENEDIAIINKPAGMIVHPAESGRHLSGSLVNALLYHFGPKSLSDVGGFGRFGIVHRLDKDTSGLMIVAKNNEIHRYLVELMKSRSIKKKYMALALGKFKHKSGIIDSPVARSARNRKKMSVTTESEGKKAVTEFVVAKYINQDRIHLTLLDITLHTGRTHQIRVHLSSIGHPVAGDSTYGNKKTNDKLAQKGLTRQFLHSCEIEFKMPGGEKIHVKTDLPPDLKKFYENLSK